MFSFLSSFFASAIPGGSSRRKKNEPTAAGVTEQYINAYDTAQMLHPIGPLDTFDNLARSILDCEHHSWSGILVGLSNPLDYGLLVHHSMHLQGNGKDPGEESSYALSAMVRSDLLSLTGRWSPNITRFSASLGEGPFSVSMRGQLSSDVRQNFLESDVGMAIDRLCLTLKTQSFYYWAFSWSLPLSRNIGIGSEISMCPTPDSLMSRIKVGFRLKSLGFSTVSAYFSTGSLPQPEDEFSLSYDTQVFMGCSAAAQYHLSKDRGKWSSVVKLGCSLADPSTIRTLRASIDSNMKICCVAEEFFGNSEDDWNFQWSAKADFIKNAYDFGVGIFMSV